MELFIFCGPVLESVTTISRRALELLRTEGVLALVREGIALLSKQLQWRYWALRGGLRLSLCDIEAEFSVPSYAVFERTTARFRAESDQLRDVISETRVDDVFFDIGANTGLYTNFVAQACSAGQVVAFEPYAPNTELLSRDVKKNGLTNVEVFEMALSDEDGTVSIDVPSRDDAGYGSASIPLDESGEIHSSHEVPTATGDTLVSEGDVPTPNVIKIDVEGAEYLVLKGLRETLRSRECRLVYCEVHLSESEKRPSIQNQGMDLADIEEYLRQLGFEIVLSERRNTEAWIKAKK